MRSRQVQYMYRKELVNLVGELLGIVSMKNLCIFTLYDELGASSQYRAYIFREELEKNFNIKWYAFWDNNYVTKYMHNKKKYILQIAFQYICAYFRRWYQLNFIATRSDVVFIQKGIIPRIQSTFLKKIKNKGIKIVFDVDDAVYTMHRDNSALIAKEADCVICGNDTLKAYYSKFNKNCVTIPTIENTLMYEPYWSNTFDSKVIGWIGSKTTIDNFDLIIDALNWITSRHPEVKIHIISNTALDYTTKINNAYLFQWEPSSYINDISRFSIGIMPLKDNEINRGKCGFKLIQYLNMKKPVIASGVGVNGEIVEGNGIVANTEDEWIAAIEKLLYDRDYYDDCVKHIEGVFFDTYHFSKVAQQLLKIIDGTNIC